MSSLSFWSALDSLVASSELVIDRPKASIHPRWPDLVYPLDYGYLAGTQAGDGDGIDVWLGSLPGRAVVGALCSVDVYKRDAEIKLLLGCSAAEIETAAAFLRGAEAGVLVLKRP